MGDMKPDDGFTFTPLLVKLTSMPILVFWHGMKVHLINKQEK